MVPPRRGVASLPTRLPGLALSLALRQSFQLPARSGFMDPAIIEVALPLAVPGTFHYRVPPELQAQVAVGREVVVPLGRRRLSGAVVAVGTEPPADLAAPIRDILEITPGQPLFSESQIPFFRWLSRYYLTPLGEVIRTALPGELGASPAGWHGSLRWVAGL